MNARQEGYCNLHTVLKKDILTLSNLVTGDLIYLSDLDQFLIFDGNQIIPLVNGCVPQQFRVIEGNVPTNYWSSSPRDFVWFDHTFVYNQCLENIQYGLVNDRYSIFTTFVYQNKTYKIIYDYIAKFLAEEEESIVGFESDETLSKMDAQWNEDLSFIKECDFNQRINEFKNLLDQKDLIPFSAFSEHYMNEESDGATLFCIGPQ